MKKRLKYWISLLALAIGVSVLFPVGCRRYREDESGREEQRLAATRDAILSHRDGQVARVGPDGEPTPVTLSLRDAHDRALKLLEQGMPDQPILLAAYTGTQPRRGVRFLVLYLLDPDFEMCGVFVEGKDGKTWDFPDVLDWDELNKGDGVIPDSRVFNLIFRVGPNEVRENNEPNWYNSPPEIWLSSEDMGNNPKVGLIYREDQRTEAIPCLFRVLSEEKLVVGGDEEADDE